MQAATRTPLVRESSMTVKHDKHDVECAYYVGHIEASRMRSLPSCAWKRHVDRNFGVGVRSSQEQTSQRHSLTFSISSFFLQTR
jgi:hypothetical protein